MVITGPGSAQASKPVGQGLLHALFKCSLNWTSQPCSMVAGKKRSSSARPSEPSHKIVDVKPGTNVQHIFELILLPKLADRVILSTHRPL